MSEYHKAGLAGAVIVAMAFLLTGICEYIKTQKRRKRRAEGYERAQKEWRRYTAEKYAYELNRLYISLLFF